MIPEEDKNVQYLKHDMKKKKKKWKEEKRECYLKTIIVQLIFLKSYKLSLTSVCVCKIDPNKSYLTTSSKFN